MARKFIYNGQEVTDPDENMTAEEVRQWAAEFYPELSNADTKVSKENDTTVYTFSKRVGTKGARVTVEVEIPDGEYCRSDEQNCRFYWEDEDGDVGCVLTSKSIFYEGDYFKIQKQEGCPLPAAIEKLEGPLSDDRG